MVNPLVTVIIPTFNWSDALRISVASVLEQSYSSFELLVIGDCCTDDSADVVSSIQDVRVSWHNLSVRAGSQTGPNNFGLTIARGDWIAYLGHDDVWHRDHLKSLVETMEGSSVDLACSVLIMYGPSGSGIRACSGVFTEGRYRQRDFIPPSSLMHRRTLVDTIGHWRMPGDVVDPVDADFVRRAHAAGARIVSTGRLTAFKFNSAWRRDSYQKREVNEQEQMLARLQEDPVRCVEEEWATLVRAVLEKRFIEMEMPRDASVKPGQSHTANLIRRGLFDAEPEHLLETRRFLPGDQTDAMDWHEPETDPALGPIRWSGKSPVCTWALPVRAPNHFWIRIKLLNILQVHLAEEVELTVDGEKAGFTIRVENGAAEFLEAEIQRQTGGEGALRVQLKVSRLRCPYLDEYAPKGDQRWLGLCFSWLEVEPLLCDNAVD